MIIVNFAHPLTAKHLAAVERLTGRAVTNVVEVRTDFDESSPFAEQTRALLNSAPLTAEQWQADPLIVNLPSYNYAAALVLAELHGRIGHFPAVLRLHRVKDSATPEFEVAEILNLQQVREQARGKR